MAVFRAARGAERTEDGVAPKWYELVLWCDSYTRTCRKLLEPLLTKWLPRLDRKLQERASRMKLLINRMLCKGLQTVRT